MAEYTLDIYDFDGTLFRSPEPLFGRRDNKEFGRLKYLWFQDAVTLEPPFVPEVPGEEWWIEETVTALRESIEDWKKITIVLTGRKDAIFRDRVEDILFSNGLLTEGVTGVFLKKEGYTTFEYKCNVIKRLLHQYKPAHVRLWEDRVKHMKRFEKWFKDDMNVKNLDAHLIQAPPIFLTEEEENEIMRQVFERNPVIPKK